MWNSLSGYVMIRLDGLGLERMLNAMLQAGIPVWNVKKEGRARMTLEMRAKDFHRIRPLKRGKRCRIHILERHGAPFVYARFRFRQLLLLGTLLCGLLVIAAQTRIWLIRVDGAVRVPKAVVLRAAEEAGVYTGMPRGGIELASLSQAIRTYDDRIAWAGARMDGIILTLELVEAEPIPPLPDKSIPSDVVAKKDAIVEKVTALSGKSNVKPGDAVRAGEVLIRGDITREGAAERLYVFAEGEVLAQVWYTSTITLPCTEERLLPSGKSEPFRVIEVARLSLFRTQSAFAEYEETVTRESVQRGLVLPLHVKSGVRYELTKQEVPANADEIIAEALFRAELAALEQVPKDAKIVKKVSESSILEDGSVRAVVAVCTLEQIGITKPIGASAQLSVSDGAN